MAFTTFSYEGDLIQRNFKGKFWCFIRPNFKKAIMHRYQLRKYQHFLATFLKMDLRALPMISKQIFCTNLLSHFEIAHVALFGSTTSISSRECSFRYSRMYTNSKLNSLLVSIIWVIITWLNKWVLAFF